VTTIFKSWVGRQGAALALAATVVTLIPAWWSDASAGKFKVLHSFCSGGSCGDGSQPQGALVIDSVGNFFGTTESGGHDFDGTVFELSPTDAGKLKFNRIFSFCSRTDCLGGAHPQGALIVDNAGNLYGTATDLGQGNGGVVFKLTRGSKRWNETVLYSFCHQSGCSDGARPAAGLTYAGAASGVPYDGESPLYGTTASGGANNAGTAFKLSQSGGQWIESVLHDFCSEGGAACTDGKLPLAALLVDQAGNLYGATVYGGSDNIENGGGTVFELSSVGGVWTHKVLYRFCSLSHCKDGYGPLAALTMDSAGSLLGTTAAGGRTCSQHSEGCGVVFKLVPDGDGWQESVLYAFCRKPDCSDGSAPAGSVLLDSFGNLFGTTQNGGGFDIDFHSLGGGVVFEFTSSSLNILHRFCSSPECSDGAQPSAGLALDADGTLYGTTQFGGSVNDPSSGGTVYKVVAP
jgi:uncharacterized repeat protein (TIGR03803 family)